ncbi:MAG: TatA/E family twin arginine-targeting protein translocase [Synechococcus sp.]|nr:TatA/E family twin arginine-targeting protein translocase [Synechococcus sp.]
MNFFGIGLPELAVIAAIGLLVFGPRRLPELGKTLGRTLKGFQSASQEFEKEFRTAIAAEPEVSADPEPAATPALTATAVAPTTPAVAAVEPMQASASTTPAPEPEGPAAQATAEPSSPAA